MQVARNGHCGVVGSIDSRGTCYAKLRKRALSSAERTGDEHITSYLIESAALLDSRDYFRFEQKRRGEVGLAGRPIDIRPALLAVVTGQPHPWERRSRPPQSLEYIVRLSICPLFMSFWELMPRRVLLPKLPLVSRLSILCLPMGR